MLKHLNCSEPFSSYLKNGWENGFATYSKERKESGAKVIPQLVCTPSCISGAMEGRERAGRREGPHGPSAGGMDHREYRRSHKTGKSYKTAPYPCVVPNWAPCPQP